MAKDWIRNNVILAVAMLIAFVFLMVSFFIGTIERSKMLDTVATLDAKSKKLDKEMSALASVDVKEDVERLTEDGVNAREIGKTIVRVQNELAKVYRDSTGANDRTDTTGLYEELATVVDGISPGSMNDIWKGNVTWSLELKTVANYRKADQIPVVFVMENDAGDLMGVVRGQYDRVTNRVVDVSIMYTSKGDADLAIMTRG